VRDLVSIPQSGFGAFERGAEWYGVANAIRFQSLSRDSGRLNSPTVPSL